MVVAYLFGWLCFIGGMAALLAAYLVYENKPRANSYDHVSFMEHCYYPCLKRTPRKYQESVAYAMENGYILSMAEFEDYGQRLWDTLYDQQRKVSCRVFPH